MLFIILIETLLMLTLKGTDGQQIIFDPLKLISPCTQGLRNGTDKFMLTGTIGRNYSALVSSNWYASVIVQLSVSSSQWMKLCEMYIGPAGDFCDPASTDICYCDHVNTTTGSVHFVVKHPTQLDYSGRVIRAQWENSNGTVVHSANNVTLPAIYDVNKARMTIKVNDEPTNQISDRFEVSLVPNKNSTVQLCCINTASPCYPRMLLNGQVFENQTSNCVSFTVSQPNNYTASVTSLYSVCSTSDYITAGVGVITTVQQNVSSTTTESKTTEATPTAPAAGTTEVTTTTTTLMPSISSSTAPEKPGSDEDKITLIVCLSVIIPIVVIALCVGAVYFYKKNKKKSKAVTNGGTNESGPNENEQDHQETNKSAPKDDKGKVQDRQPSAGYVNHGFDRRTSPSSITVDTTQDNTPQQRTVKEKNGSNKQFTGKTNGSASKDTPGEPRQLPPLKGTQSHDYLQQPSGQSRPVSVEMTSSAKK